MSVFVPPPPRLPDTVTEAVGQVIHWSERKFTPEGDLIDGVDPQVVLIIGARWMRTLDGRIVFPQLVQFLMDRGDGTMRWSDPIPSGMGWGQW